FCATIETALLAGTPWLAYQCPSCQLIGDIDLRTLDRHPLMPTSGLIPSLSCRWCCSNPPFAKLIGLTAQSTEKENERSKTSAGDGPRGSRTADRYSEARLRAGTRY